MVYDWETNQEATIRDCYAPAMELETIEEAQEYLEKLIIRCVNMWGKTREEAEQIERSNLGYYSGYYSYETMEKVARLFGAVHPIFGDMAKRSPVTTDEAFEAGKNYGKDTK